MDCLQVNARPGSEAERLKAAGNDAFKAKDWSSAVQLYRSAMTWPFSRRPACHVLQGSWELTAV
jgi:hypothetical protein